MTNMQTIEINGQKYELDLSNIKRVQTYKVGDRVKVLIKKYGTNYEVNVGAIVGIDAFAALPSVVVAYIPADAWQDPKIEFVTLNANTTDTEIAPMCGDEIQPTRDTILGMFKRAENALEVKLAELRAKRDYFEARFGGSIGHVLAEAMAEQKP